MTSLSEREQRIAEVIARRFAPPPGGEEVVDAVAQIFGVGARGICYRSKRAEQVAARDVVATILHGRGWSEVHIGNLLGQRHPSTVSEMLKRCMNDPELRMLARELAAA